jgi:uncharacterized membrane protein YgcG
MFQRQDQPASDLQSSASFFKYRSPRNIQSTIIQGIPVQTSSFLPKTSGLIPPDNVRQTPEHKTKALTRTHPQSTPTHTPSTIASMCRVTTYRYSCGHYYTIPDSTDCRNPGGEGCILVNRGPRELGYRCAACNPPTGAHGTYGRPGGSGGGSGRPSGSASGGSSRPSGTSSGGSRPSGTSNKLSSNLKSGKR